MHDQRKLKLASFLYERLFPVYRQMYFRFKNKKDRDYMNHLRQLIKPGSCVLDIGSNIGFYTRFFSDLVGPDGRVYGFEPDKTNFRHLSDEVSKKKNVTIEQKAVASSSGMLTLYTSPLLNVDHRTYEPESYSGKYTVEKISMDDYISGKFRVDFIKMDIQGFETDAIQGMNTTLKANENLLLFMELWPHGLQKAGSSAVEAFDLLSTFGFIMYKINSATLTRMDRKEVSRMSTDYFSDTNVLLSRRDDLDL